MSYSKLFGSMLDSTVWDLPHATRIVWVTMLAMKDRDGIVEASVPGLARRARVTREECETALLALASPDPDSRTKDHEGRRIEEVDGGWRVLNHFKYREKDDRDEQRKKNADRQAKWRERHKDDPRNATVTPSNATSPSVAQPYDMHLHSDSSGSSDPGPQGADSGGDRDREAQDAPDRAQASDEAPARESPAPTVRELVREFVARVNAARQDIAARHGLKGVGPLPAFGGERETALSAALGLAGADARRQLEHVLAVAIAESDAGQSVDWLGWSLGRSWTTKLQQTPDGVAAEAKRRRRKSARIEPKQVTAAAARAAGDAVGVDVRVYDDEDGR